MLEMHAYLVANNAYRVSGSNASQAHAQTGREMQEAIVESVLLLWWRLHVACDQDSHHEGVDCYDSRHNNRDEGLMRFVIHKYRVVVSDRLIPS